MALDVGGFVVAQGTFDLAKQDLTIDDGSLTAFDADVLSLGAPLARLANGRWRRATLTSCFVLAGIASVYPAFVAARLVPMEAMRIE